MSFKSLIVKPIAKFIARTSERQAHNAWYHQQKIFHSIIQKASNTVFGKEHHFSEIRNYEDFKKRVPIRDYEGLKLYVDKIIDGHSDILWPGRPKYFAKTSGTTSGVKYIPITKDSIPNHFGSARNALFNYVAKTGNGNWLDGKMIFLSGSPKLENKGGIPTGRLSGISNHLVPGWIKASQLPSYPTNIIEEWEDKVQLIVEETINSDLRLISGIPPWVQMYYEKLIEKSGKKTIKDIFPNFSVFVYGGVNYAPYQSKLESLTGFPINSVETYPASEGFIAWQDTFPHSGLRLNINSGIFFEFIPLSEIHQTNPIRLQISQVEMGVQYVLIINSNAGLWGYNIGDTVEFTSLMPPRIKVTGRVKHFISAFGEHVIGKEVEEALLETAQKYQINFIEFTVAPQVNPSDSELPYHEWFVEFDTSPEDLGKFEEEVDRRLCEKNIYYQDLIEGKILRPLIIRPMPPHTFRNYMKSIGKLGGQNKVPRLANDRMIADELSIHVTI